MLQHPVSDAVGDLAMPLSAKRLTFTAERLESLYLALPCYIEVTGQLLWKNVSVAFFTHHVDVALIYCLFVSADDDEAQVSAV